MSGYIPIYAEGVSDSKGKAAANTVAELTNLANTLGLYTPARDVYLDWFHGNDTTSSTLTAGSANDGVWLDMSEINPDSRTVVILVDTGTSLDFDYVIKFSRSGLTADEYSSGLTGTAVATQETKIHIPATQGYDLYIQLEVTPDAGQSGDQLGFKAYLVGRGG